MRTGLITMKFKGKPLGGGVSFREESRFAPALLLPPKTSLTAVRVE